MPFPRYITRSNRIYAKGWIVCIYSKTERVNKYFGDHTYGSWRSSARAAIQYRNSIMPVRVERRGRYTGKRSRRSGSINHRRYVQHAPSSNSITGVVGVSPQWKKGRLTGYMASICREKNKQTNKRFAISKYGEDEAFRLAVEWRQKQVRNILSQEE